MSKETKLTVKSAPMTPEQFVRLRRVGHFQNILRQQLHDLLHNAAEEEMRTSEAMFDEAAQALGYANIIEAQADGKTVAMDWVTRSFQLHTMLPGKESR